MKRTYIIIEDGPSEGGRGSGCFDHRRGCPGGLGDDSATLGCFFPFELDGAITHHKSRRVGSKVDVEGQSARQGDQGGDGEEGKGGLHFVLSWWWWYAQSLKYQSRCCMPEKKGVTRPKECKRSRASRGRLV